MAHFSIGEGFVEGILAPIGEAMVVISTPALQALQNATNALATNSTLASSSSWGTSPTEVFGMLLIFELVKDLVIGILFPLSGLGYVVGALIGLFIMYNILASSGVWAVIGGIFCVVLGMGLRLYFAFTYNNGQ